MIAISDGTIPVPREYGMLAPIFLDSSYQMTIIVMFIHIVRLLP